MVRNDPPPPPLEVVFLALPETTTAALYSMVEVFLSVGVTWTELTGEDAPVRRINPRILARRAEPFLSPLGTPIVPHADLSEPRTADLVVLTDLALSPNVDPRGRWPEEVAWLRSRFEDGAILASVCTGAVTLAEAGLLDGIEATTHWSACGWFERHYPRVDLRAQRILCPAGPEHRIVTSGGATSWEDLALYVIARFCGEAEAVRIAKIFVMGDRSDGQLAYAAMTRPRSHDDRVIAECQAWIADNYTAPNPVARMVERSGLPARTFVRRFRAATGYTPVDYVQALRIEEAKHMLESSAEPTDAVAHAVGYEDPAFFRRLFKRRAGTSPSRYRQRFQPIRAGLGDRTTGTAT